jgi:PKD repeat protein
MLKSLVEKLFTLMFIAILIGMLIPQSCFFTKASPEPGPLPSDRPVVYIDPPIVQAVIDEYFTINVKVFNLTDNWIVVDPVRRTKHWIGNLFGLELKLSWDPTILNYTSHVVKIPVEVYSDGVLHGDPTDPSYGMYWIKDDVNVTAGTYELAVSSMLNPEPFNNPGQSNIIFNMTFKVIGYGSSYITLDSTELAALYDPSEPTVSTIIYHHPKWPYPDFVSDAYHEYPGAPIAKFTMFPADAAVVDKPVIFNATESETSDESLVIEKYMWDFGDGTTQNTTGPFVEHTYTGMGIFTIKLVVMDNSTIPLRSAPFVQTLEVVRLREVVVKSYSVSDEILLLGASLNVTVVVKNDGEWDENFVLTAYYNKTMLEWAEISNITVNLPSGNELSVKLIWDTSLVGPYDEGYYALMVNITTVIPHEENVTNNFAPRPPTEIPGIVVFLTSELIYDMAVEGLRIVTVGAEGREFSSPFLVRESLVISASVMRKGTFYETFNATIDIIHFNGTVVVSKAWLLQELGAGNRSVVLTYTFSTANLTTGYYNVSMHVVNSNVTNAELDVNKTNNVVSMLVKVVEPPVLKISKPDAIYVNDTVTLSAADSTHAGGNFAKYIWEVYEGTTRRADLSGNSSDPYWTVSFDKSGRWKVILVVVDDNGITYDANRPVSAAYRLSVNVDVSEKQVGAWLPMELLLALILVVVVIVGSVVYLKWGKGRGKPPS